MKQLTILLLAFLLMVVFILPGYATLQQGDSNQDVVTLQERLIELGYLTGNADGNFSDMTENSVRLFQSMNSLDITGIVTIKDINVLFSDQVFNFFKLLIQCQLAKPMRF